jgi:hypothetical protein
MHHLKLIMCTRWHLDVYTASFATDGGVVRFGRRLSEAVVTS